MGNIISYQPVRKNGKLIDIFVEYRVDTKSGYIIDRDYLSNYLPGNMTISELSDILHTLEN